MVDRQRDASGRRASQVLRPEAPRAQERLTPIMTDPAPAWRTGSGWRDRALCAQDPDAWFPHERDVVANARAKTICRACPVRPDCLEDTLSRPLPPIGIWAGLGVRELRKLQAIRRGRRKGGAEVIYLPVADDPQPTQ